MAEFPEEPIYRQLARIGRVLASPVRLRLLDELPRDVEIVAYCGGPYCVASPEAVRLLRDHGFRARPLDGGLTRWRRAGRRLRTGSAVAP